MNRRRFLQLASIAAAALTVDPERLLWTPGQRTFFLPTVDQIHILRSGDFVISRGFPTQRPYIAHFVTPSGGYDHYLTHGSLSGWDRFKANSDWRGRAVGVVKTVNPLVVQVSGKAEVNAASFDEMSKHLNYGRLNRVDTAVAVLTADASAVIRTLHMTRKPQPIGEPT